MWGDIWNPRERLGCRQPRPRGPLPCSTAWNCSSSSPQGWGGLGRGGRQAAPRVSQLCFLPLPPLWLLNQSPGTLPSQLVPIHRLSHQTVSRQIFTQHLPERSQGRDGILRKAEDSAVLESGVASHTGSHSHSAHSCTHTHQHTTHTLNTHTHHPPWFKPTFSVGASASPSVGGAQSTQLL